MRLHPVTYEAIRQWCLKFGQEYANQLKRRRPRTGEKWHLDEVFLTINVVPAFLTTSQELLTLAELRAGERVLDVACGTGIVARLAAAVIGPAGVVVCTDVNEGMLHIARTVPPLPHSPEIAWRHSDAAALPFPAAAFDVVCCQHGLEFFADRAAGLREFARVLVPGGCLVLWVWRALERQRFHVPLLAAVDRYMGVDARQLLQAPFTLGDATALRYLVAGAGFRQVHLRITTNVLRYPSLEAYVRGFLTAMLIAPAIAALDVATRTAMVQEVTRALAEYVDDDGLTVPAESHVVRAQI